MNGGYLLINELMLWFFNSKLDMRCFYRFHQWISIFLESGIFVITCTLYQNFDYILKMISWLFINDF